MCYLDVAFLIRYYECSKQHELDVAVGFLPHFQLIAFNMKHFQHVFSMLQTLIFDVAILDFLSCRTLFLMLRGVTKRNFLMGSAAPDASTRNGRPGPSNSVI